MAMPHGSSNSRRIARLSSNSAWAEAKSTTSQARTPRLLSEVAIPRRSSSCRRIARLSSCTPRRPRSRLQVGQHARGAEHFRTLPRWLRTSCLRAGFARTTRGPRKRIHASTRSVAAPRRGEDRRSIPEPRGTIRGSAQVLVLFVEAPQPRGLLRTPQFRFHVLRQREEVVAMPCPSARRRRPIPAAAPAHAGASSRAAGSGSRRRALRQRRGSCLRAR